MEIWGAGGFENDAAKACLTRIDSVDDLADLFEELPEDLALSIAADQAQRLIAAAECVAAMAGRPAADIPAEIEAKLAAFGPPHGVLVEVARESVSNVLGRSALTGLWAERDSAAFNLAMTSLIERLNPELPEEEGQPEAARQTCCFCNREVEPKALFSLEVRHRAGLTAEFDQGVWCHLACLNARVHPDHLIQHWKFDPAVIEELATELLKGKTLPT